jgi:hypothetical protein
MQSGDTPSLISPNCHCMVNLEIAGFVERRHKLGKIEAVRHNVRENSGTRGWHSTNTDRFEDGKAVVSQLTGALTRAVLVMILVATPSMLLLDVTADTKQMVALVALFLGLLTFIEYNSAYPSLVEFRDAPPFNRIRFLMLFATVFFLSTIERGRFMPSNLTDFADAVGTLIGVSMDFPYSPVRLATLMISDTASVEQVAAVRTAAGMAYLISLISLSIFVVALKSGNWPSRGRAFNVWTNLPTFDPTAGGDVVMRLQRDARVNIALGFLLPFLTPAVVMISSSGFEPLTMTSSQTLIWTMTAWAFLPASLFMRGIAMGRVADMIQERRRANRVQESGGLAAV